MKKEKKEKNKQMKMKRMINVKISVYYIRVCLYNHILCVRVSVRVSRLVTAAL